MNRNFFTMTILFLSLSVWLSAAALTAHSEEPTGEVVVRKIIDFATQAPNMQDTKYHESIRDAALSGDGRKVMASLLIKGKRIINGGRKQTECALYLCNSDGTGLKKVLDSGEALPDERIYNRGPITRVAITDDGSKIAFGWLTEYVRPGYEGGVVVSTINADGTGLKKVARVRNFGVPGIGALAISGDGSKIAFSTRPWKKGDTDYSDYEVFLVNADGTNLVQLTDNNVPDAIDRQYYLDISDDGARVVWQHGDKQIYGYDGVTNRMGVLAEGYYRPSISGNGQTVLFGSVSGWPYKVGIIGFDGTGLQVFDAPDSLRENFISDDGNALAFLCGPGSIDRLMFMRADGTDKIKLDTASDVYAISDDGTKVLHRHGNALYIAHPPGTEKPAEAKGLTIICPHCGKPITLTGPEQALASLRILGAVGVASTQPEAGKTFASEAARCSIAVPEGWKVDTSDLDLVVRLQAPDEITKIKVDMDEVEPGTTAALYGEVVVHVVKKEGAKVDKKGQLSNAVVRRAGADSGFNALLAFTEQDMTLNIWEYVFVKGNRVYNITVVFPPDANESSKDAFEGAVSSFRILGATPK